MLNVKGISFSVNGKKVMNNREKVLRNVKKIIEEEILYVTFLYGKPCLEFTERRYTYDLIICSAVNLRYFVDQSFEKLIITHYKQQKRKRIKHRF